jgi:acyl-CoA dehydrogenase
MSDDQLLLRDTVHKILSPDKSFSKDETVAHWPSQTWVELENAGMTGVGINELSGGSGGSILDVAIMAFESGRNAALTPLVETAMLAGWLVEMADWSWTGGVETLGIAASATFDALREDTTIVLSGKVLDVPWARFAKRVILVLELNGDTVIAQLLPEVYSIEPGLNVAGEPRDTLILKDVRLDADHWIVSPIFSDDIRRRCAFARAISSAGAMSSILDMTIDFAKDRQQFGRPIAKFQAVQHLLAQLAEEVFASVVSTRMALDAISTGGGDLEAMSAIVRVARAATKVARISHQVHGAIGATEEYSLHHYTKRLWSWRNEFGGEAAWSRAITEHVHEHGGPEHLWSILTDEPGVKSRLNLLIPTVD